MKTNKPATVLYRALTSSLLASHGGLVHRALLEIERKEDENRKGKDNKQISTKNKQSNAPQSLMDLVKYSPGLQTEVSQYFSFHSFSLNRSPVYRSV